MHMYNDQSGKPAIMLFAVAKGQKKGVLPPASPSKSDKMDMPSENGHEGSCEECDRMGTPEGCGDENCPNRETDSEETPMPENGKKGKMGLEAIKMMLKKALEEE
jgi:hypothetical protein